MSHKLLSATIVLLLAAAAWSADITVRGVGAGKDSVRLDGLGATGEVGELFRQTLQNDLLRSGWFRIDAAGQIVVGGTAQPRPGGGVMVASRVTWPGHRFDWNGSAASAPETRRLAHRLADEIVQRVKGERGMASTRIVFVNRRGPNDADLYMCDADGRNLLQITNDRTAAVGPRWDRDGQHVLYTSFIGGAPTVFRFPASGGRRLPLTRFRSFNTGAVMSPDGYRTAALVLAIAGNPDIYTLDLATGGARRLTQTPHAVEASPSWSPDSSRIVYVGDAAGAPHLYVVDVATRRSRRLTYKGSENVNPNWGPNGLIAYATRRGGVYQIAVLDPAAAAEPEVTLTQGPDHETPAWAPDGRHIVCSRNEGYGQSSLWILDMKGDSPVRLFANQGNWMSPDWSSK